MYFEAIAELTCTHLRSHVEDYLEAISARYMGKDRVPLIVPKSIDATSVVGGMWTEFDNILPQYGVDVLGRSFSGVADNLFEYEYPGQINGMVHAMDEQTVDRICKRHCEAVERFIKEHQLMHQHTNDQFSIIELGHSETTLSGAEQINGEDNKTIWIAGFSVNVIWLVSEDGPSQHA